MLGGLSSFALALVRSWCWGYYVLGLGFARIPTQHPSSSTFADAFPSTRVSPGSIQGQPTMGTYPPSLPSNTQGITHCKSHPRYFHLSKHQNPLPCLPSAQRGCLSLSKQIFQIFLAAPCFPLLSCNKGSKMFFPLGTSSGIN